MQRAAASAATACGAEFLAPEHSVVRVGVAVIRSGLDTTRALSTAVGPTLARIGIPQRFSSRWIAPYERSVASAILRMLIFGFCWYAAQTFASNCSNASPVMWIRAGMRGRSRSIRCLSIWRV